MGDWEIRRRASKEKRRTGKTRKEQKNRVVGWCMMAYGKVGQGKAEKGTKGTGKKWKEDLG